MKIIVIYRGILDNGQTHLYIYLYTYIDRTFRGRRFFPGFAEANVVRLYRRTRLGIAAPGWRRNGERFNIHGRKYRARILSLARYFSPP